MRTFTARDRRRNLVAEAIAAAATRIDATETALAALADGDPGRPTLEQQLADLQQLAAGLADEQNALADDRWELSDVHTRALASDFVFAAVDLRAALAGDRALAALEREAAVTIATAASVDAIPRVDGEPRRQFFSQVEAAVADADAAREIVGAALGDWIGRPAAQRANPLRDIGVLLPLRLETLFDEHPDGTFQLSLRVVPDEPSIRRDQPNVTPGEVAALDDFWDRSRVMSPTAAATPAEWLEHPEGTIAFAQLSDRVTGPRAAWLVSTFPAAIETDAFTATIPLALIGHAVPARVGGLPDVLVVVAIDASGVEHTIGTLEPDAAALILKLPRTSQEAFDTWVSSWERAKEVGLGGEFALPPGLGPDTIDALFVCGIGDEPSAEHFAALATSGEMGLLRLGAPTNTVHGAPAADLGQTADQWRIVAINRLRNERSTSVQTIAVDVCGDSTALAQIPGGTIDLHDSALLVQALGPALWGHFFRDLWQCGDEAHLVGLWAMDALPPEGPYQPLRISTQPYGLLPVTSLERWQASGTTDIDVVEERIAQTLQRLLPVWVDAAVTRGTVVGADTERLLELLARTGVSTRYLYRIFLSAELLAAAYPGVPQANFVQEAEQRWREATDAIRHAFVRPYLAIGYGQHLTLPLVGARRMPAAATMVQVLEALYGGQSIVFQEPMMGVMPDSLLVRLLLYSVHLTKAWFMQAAEAVTTPLINPLRWDHLQETTPLEQFQYGFASAAEVAGDLGPIGPLMLRQRKAAFALAEELDKYRRLGPDVLDPAVEGASLDVPDERRAALERALSATLDAAGHRLDPWATGIAWRRLRAHASSFRRQYRLGAYGWLDGPFLGHPGPTRAGRLHAPSYTQALTSLILRDKFLSSEHERTADNRNVWKMELTSSGVRVALEMADEMRQGFHFFEVLGRRVEGIVAAPDRIRTLRKAAPLRPDRPDATEVCHGPAALDGLLAETIAGVLTPAHRVEQLAQLAELKRALETYADLLTAEGVHQVVTGHADLAAEVMDAAAGFSRPPAFEFVRTPPSGYRLPTTVVTVLRHEAPVAAGTPVAIVDASLAAFLAARFGEASAWTWRAQWTEANPNGEVVRQESVTLADLGLDPLGVILVAEDFLIEAVRMHLGAPAASVEPPEIHRLARQAAGALGSRPATLPDLSRVADVPQATLESSEKEQHRELRERYEEARRACTSFAAAVGVVTDAQQVEWLRRALAWGVTGPPAVSSRQALLNALFGTEAASPADLDALVKAGQVSLAARLAAAPSEADAAKLTIVDLARALARLVASDGKLTITVAWDADALVDVSGLNVDAVDADLDKDWLSVMAAVRPALSRVEALQLEARVLDRFEPLSAWSSTPGDPWQIDLVGQNVTTREAEGITELDTRRFVAAYGPGNAWAGGSVAVALIDQFTEAIPMAERSTFAAFGFNAPAARAPQAILLAVPPKSDARLETSDLLQILKETRLLVRARASRPDDVTRQPAAPSMWFQGGGALRMRLDADTQWSR